MVLVERLTATLHVQSLIGFCTGVSRCHPLLRGAIQEKVCYNYRASIRTHRWE